MGEFVVVTTGQNEEGLHNVSHIDDKSHEYWLHVLPVKPGVIIAFAERCVNHVHVLVEGIEPRGSGSDNSRAHNDRDNNRSCEIRYDGWQARNGACQ